MNVVEALAEVDVEAAHSLVLATYADNLRPYVTMTQQGADVYLSRLVEYGRWHPNRHLLVVKSEGLLVGFAEFRTMNSDSGFLNHICVSQQARGRGIATALIRHYLDKRPNLRRLELDVFSDNLAARSLYRKIGFREGRVSTWWKRPLPPARGYSGDLEMPPMAFPIAVWERYGFSEFTVNWNGRPVRVGLIGESTLRLFDDDEFLDTGLLSNLSAVFPRADSAMAVLSSTSGVAGEGCSVISTALRMILETN